MSWMGEGLMFRKHGDKLDQEIGIGGSYLHVYGRTINKNGSLGGYFSHRRGSTWWYANEQEAMDALLALALEEGVSKHPTKPEIDLRKPGIIEAVAFVEPQRW